MYGNWQVVALPGAAATAGITYLLPEGEYTRLGALAFALTTAAGGGARQVVVQVKDGTGAAVFANAAPATQAGGLTVVYSFAPDVQAFGAAALGFVGGPIFGGWFADNMSVVVQVVSSGAGDVLFDGRLLVAQYEREPDLGG